MEEIWKPIKNYETFYEVSNIGNIRNIKTNKLLKPSLNHKGYYKVCLCNSKEQKNILVHRLVAENFLDSIKKEQVNHKNGIKTDNRVENLEWVTCKENIIHSYKNGLQPHAKKVRCIETNEIFISQSEACKKYKIRRTNLSYCVNGKRRTVGGLHWERVF